MPELRPSLGRSRSTATAALAVGALLAAGTLAAPPVAHASSPTLSAWLTTADGSTNLAQQPSVTLGSVSRGSVNVAVDDSLKYQTITGFGAAFTDSSTYLMNQLKSYSSSTYQSLIDNLFTRNGADGIGLSFARIPMGASDEISESSDWSDDDSQGPSTDPTANFGLTPQENSFTIPVIKDALAANPNLTTVASPWSAPAWMKSNGSMVGSTNGTNATLLSQYDQAWADYFVKWIKAYDADGVPIKFVTPQNEPEYGPTDYPGLTWSATDEADWIKNYLAPDLKNNGLSTSILGFDHNWALAAFPQSQLADSSANADLAGVGWHCYEGDPTAMTQLHNAYPDKDTYETECSSTPTVPAGSTGVYSTAQMALLSVQNWAKGVLLWNLALNSSGGPHLGGCGTCAPEVSIDPTTDSHGTVTSASLTYDNNFYQLGQISKFVQTGATHINSTVNAHGIVTAAFQNPDGQEVLVANNTNSSATTFTTTWNGQGSFSYTLPANATVTFTGNVPAAPALSSTPSAGHVFKIVSRTSGKPVGVYGASTSDGGSIVQYTDDDDPDQQWKLVDAGSGYDNIVDVNSGMALDDTNGSTSDGTPMQQWTLAGTGNSNQQWQITSNGDGYYKITNRASGLVLDDTNGSLADSNPIQQWTAGSGNPNQEWQFVPVS